MKNRGIAERKILTTAGIIKYKRTILIPADLESKNRLCELTNNTINSIIPLDIALQVSNLPFKMTVNTMLLIAFIAINQKSYESSQEVLEKILKYKISDDTIRKVVNFIGKLVFEAENTKCEELLKNKDIIITNSCIQSNGIFYIETDGNFINLLKKGVTGSTWHENKMGLVFNSDDIETKINSKGEIYRIIKKREYISYFCPVDEFKKYLYCLALKNNYYKYKTCILISDGAAWIKNFRKEYIPGFIHILDFYHLADNTGKFARYIYKSNIKLAKEKTNEWCALLKNSEYEKVLRDLEQFKDIKCNDGVVNLYTYILNNIECIDYKFYQKQDYIFGSGGIEGANKYVMQSRMKLSGMRWGEDTSQYIAILRAKYCSNLWNEVEEVVINYFLSLFNKKE